MQPCNAANIKSNQFKNEFQIKNCMSIAIQNLILEISMKSKLSSTLKKSSHIIFKEVKNQNQNQSQNQNLSENLLETSSKMFNSSHLTVILNLNLNL